jgi:hypothetical protein
MANQAHTQGPWKAIGSRVFSETYLTKTPIATIHAKPEIGVQTANARLIAAAPNLLEALNEMMQIARFYMRQSKGFLPDNFCDADINSHSHKYERAFEAVQKAGV